jgi:SAM-dependent methyltransferase
MNHVLEHIMDLKNILFNIKRVLKKDGIIFIGTPNFDGFFRKITGRRWLGLRPKEHVWQFEPKTITKVLNSAGFKVLKIEKNASHNLVSLFVFRDGFSWKEFLMNILNWLFGLMGFGDNLFIIATQNDEQQKGVAN